MKTMRSLAAVLLLALMFSALIGCGKVDTTQTMASTTEYFGPLTYQSEAEFAEAVTNSAAEGTDALYDDYNLANIDFYYRPPSELIKDATLETINVKDLYVTLYYYLEELDETKYEDSLELDIARIENTVKLEWIRRENGEEWLANDIENFSLKEYGDGVYYYDIVFPDYPDRIPAKSFFWVQDGYLLNMDVPQKLIDAWDGTADGLIDTYLDVEKVFIGDIAE